MKNYTQYYLADPHFGHSKITEFKDNNGDFIRPLNWLQLIIADWKERVNPQDRVYILGDVAIKRKGLLILNKLPGKKYLIKGNHDIFKLKDYIPYFKDIRAYKMIPEYGIIFSHIPVHEEQLKNRFKFNVHGHLHNNTLKDSRYLNICLEQTNYQLITLEEIINKLTI